MIVKSAILLNDIIYIGHRHHNILHSAEERGLGFGGLKLGEQGFVDENGNFLTREEALKHFIESKQIPFRGKFTHRTMLFSEDLY